MKRRLFLFLFLISLLTVAGTNALADSFILDFGGLRSGEAVLSYYDNGTGSLGSGPGPDFGITFDPSFLAIGNDPRLYDDQYRVGLLDGPSSTMNVSGGFESIFSFHYNASDNSGLVTLWSGPDGTGVMLGSIPLPRRTEYLWYPTATSFEGTAMSVVFSGTPGAIRFTTITDEGAVVPEPSSLLLVGTGLAGLAAWFRRRMVS